jgi:predicted outer membrane repeat protein
MRVLSVLALLTACTGEKTGAGALDLSTDSVTFGDVPVGATGYETIIATNVGNAELNLLSASIVSGSSLLWTVDRSGVGALGPGQTAEITVRFTPTELGLVDGALRVRTDDPETDRVDVPLLGGAALSTDDFDADGFSPAEGDCDDDNRLSFPGAEERCDGEDNDCDGTIDASEADFDGDGVRVCAGDCDDEDKDVRPGLQEICDQKDTDCDGVEQDYLDEDGDGWNLCSGDCDDADPLAYPSGEEVCDEIDNDCNGETDDIDRDGDGRGFCEGAGDCDDTDPTAYEVFVDAYAPDGGVGTPADPHNNLFDALNDLDAVCRTVIVLPGIYEISRTWDDGFVRIEGAGDDPDEVRISPPAGTGYRAFRVDSGSVLELADLLLRDGATGGDGGALKVDDGLVRLERVTFLENSATGGGGAMWVGDWGEVYGEDVEFSGNVAQGDGGAIYLEGGAVVELDRSDLETSLGDVGGAVRVAGGSFTLRDGRISDSAANGGGGGLAASGDARVVLERVQVWSNEAGGPGGGVWLDGTTDPGTDIANSTFQDNLAAGAGGGLAATGDAVAGVVRNNTFVGGRSTLGAGAIDVEATDATGVLAWSNIAYGVEGTAGMFALEGSGAWFAWNTSAATVGAPDLTLGAGEDGGENLTGDPLLSFFTANDTPTDDDLTLQAGSPAIDSGPPDGEGPPGLTDWEDTDGSVNDRGHTGGPDAG